MLKTKDSPENIRAETSIKQQDAAGRLKDFRDWFYEKVSVGKRTELVFFFERHTFKDLELFKDWIKKNKPDVIALEEVGVEGFKKMLDGKISVEDYMERQKTSFPEFLKQRYEFLVKFHQQNRKVKIEQVGYPPELPMSPRVHLEADSFDGLIEALLFRQKMSAFDMDERDVEELL